MISKLGIASRTVATSWIVAGRVSVNDRIRVDPVFPVVQGSDRIAIDGLEVGAAARVYVALNKPRGLVTSARDEHDRATVYRCLDGSGLPWLAPVGRLDKASEGLLLLCNDPAWAAALLDPEHGPDKTYHVQIDALPTEDLLRRLRGGIACDGQWLRVKAVQVLRQGGKHAWLEIVLDEGRNRQIRRLLAAVGIAVLRLVRVAIGPLQLGDLGKGRWRILMPAEVEALTKP